MLQHNSLRPDAAARRAPRRVGTEGARDAYRVRRIVLDELYDVLLGQVVALELLVAPLPCWFVRHFERRTA